LIAWLGGFGVGGGSTAQPPVSRPKAAMLSAQAARSQTL